MSGVGGFELIVLVVVGLLILGPEKLPRVASQIGRWVGRARRTANQLRYQLEREITLADIEGKKKQKEDEAKKRDKEKEKTSDTASAVPAAAPEETAAPPAGDADSADARND